MERVTSKIVSNIFKNYDPNVEVEDFEIKHGTSQQHYFSSVIYSIHVTLRQEDGNANVVRSRTTIILKTVPQNPVRLQFLMESKYFVKEILMYTKVIPEIMAPFGFSAIPIALHTSSDGTKPYIAMEDLTPRGYQTFKDRVQGLDENHCKLVLKKLAELHSTSFVKYNGDSGKLQEDYPDIREHFWKTSLETNDVPEINRVVVQNTLRQLRKVLCDKQLEHGIPLVEKELENGHEVLTQLSKLSDGYPGVVTHGDCWTTNLLFKYNGGIPVDIKFVDFQICRVASRITDLSYFLYTSVNNQTLNEKLEEMLRLYYDTFNSCCTKFGMSLPLLFKGQELSWDNFLEEWNEYRHFGLIFALQYIPLMCSDPDNPPKLDDIEEKDMKLLDDEVDGNFDHMWTYEPMLEKLFNLIFQHLPNSTDFKLMI